MSGKMEYLDPGEIKRDTNQPRTEFDEESLQSLARSYKVHGIMDAVEIDENNVLIRGERRWRAAKIAGVKIPIKRITNLDIKTRLERQLIEHHKEYNELEKAWGYATAVININEEVRGTGNEYTVPKVKKMDQYHLINLLGAQTGGEGGTQPQGTSRLADIIGEEQMTIWNYIQILYLEEDTREMIGRGDGQVPFTFASAVTRFYPPHVKEKKTVERLLRVGKFEKNRTLLRDLCKHIVENLHIFEEQKNEETGEKEWVETIHHEVVINELLSDIEQGKYLAVASEERTAAEARADAVVRLNSYVDTYLKAHKEKVKAAAKAKEEERLRKEAKERTAKEAEKEPKHDDDGDTEEDEGEDVGESIDDDGTETPAPPPPPTPPKSPEEVVESDAEKLIRETEEARVAVLNKLYIKNTGGNSLEGKIKNAGERGVANVYITGWKAQLDEFGQRIEGIGLTKEYYKTLLSEISTVIAEITKRTSAVKNEAKVLKKIEEARDNDVPEKEIKEFLQRLEEMSEDASLGVKKTVDQLIETIDKAIKRVKLEKEKAAIAAQAQTEIDDENLEKAVTDDPDKIEKILLWNATEGLPEETRKLVMTKFKDLSAGSVKKLVAKFKDITEGVVLTILDEETDIGYRILMELFKIEESDTQLKIIEYLNDVPTSTQEAKTMIQRAINKETWRPREDDRPPLSEIEKHTKLPETVFRKMLELGPETIAIIGPEMWDQKLKYINGTIAWGMYLVKLNPKTPVDKQPAPPALPDLEDETAKTIEADYKFAEDNN